MSFYTSLTGLNAATTELAVTSNNIANSATAGFKRSTASFGDIFATSPLQRAAAVVGQGVALKEVAQEFSQGFVQFSANSLDLAITGDGFFPLQSSDGSRTFTRNGQFMLNEQNQMVNSAGQALLSLPVDSTNKADFSQPPSALAIPRQTVSEFRATTEVELGLNLPSNVEPITLTFNPNKPETYHRTTSLTVFGASGSQHLATVYYVKTQAATSENPLNKWQTYVYVDGELVDPALIQASDSGGDVFFVNKYGEIKTQSELEFLQKTSTNSSEFLVTQGTVYRKFSFDMLSDPIQSTPAALSLKAASPTDVAALSLAGGSNGLDLSAKTRENLRNLIQISVDGSDFVEIGLEHLVGKEGTDQLSGQEIADELTNVINERFGDGKKFDVSAYYASGAAIGAGVLDITRDYGESNESYLSVPVGEIIEAAIDQGDIVLTGAATSPMIMPEELATAMNKYFAGGYAAATPALAAPTGTNNRSFADLQVEYDFARQALRITQSGDDTLHFTTDAPLTGELFGAVNLGLATPGDAAQRSTALATTDSLESADGDKAVVLSGTMVPAGDLIAETRNQRYGIEVNFVDGSFVISSGTTGDGSSIAIRNVLTLDANGNADTANTTGEQLFGLSVTAGTPESENTVRVAEALSAVANRPAVRGQASTPATVQGNQMGVDPSKPFEVTEDNRSLTVIVDNISAQIQLATGQYSVGDFVTELESKINLMADKLGRQVSGVNVEFDADSSRLIITGATATDNSFLQVAGSADFGLEDVEPAFGTTSTYIRLSPDTQGTTPLYAYQDRNGEWLETTDKGTFDENDIPNWSPIFLDRGELTFDTSGTLVSPVGEAVLKSATIIGNDINVDYVGSTQFNSPFAVLNQSQNGAPEGDLVGVNIGEDGLVVASYSNGSQKSLGKIILANFATPKGLRQVGNSGFTATSQSGEAKLGEPGAAGFGTIRAGATERSNVDLTAELVALITAQRNFQANAKAIETSSTLTQTIINMRG
ncbi:MAG: flagellar biosynthesis protein FlgE [Halieaceae bacterium]|nr:flagellar biosynthesis protein FlgE [Halieaceae bacterium]|tara:strand:+ start:2726 stop:5719 length:2994 start_codon:yes stop_codon:yes gene_type:complete